MLPVGRVMHVRACGSDDPPALRPAIVAQVWDDGGNDHVHRQDPPGVLIAGGLTSAEQSDGLWQWHWPARVEPGS